MVAPSRLAAHPGGTRSVKALHYRPSYEPAMDARTAVRIVACLLAQSATSGTNRDGPEGGNCRVGSGCAASVPLLPLRLSQ